MDIVHSLTIRTLYSLQGLVALQKIHLKKIVLAECVNITDTGVEKLCKNVRDLEHVDVSRCAALTDAAIRAVSFYCRGLHTMRMSGCPKMTDMAVLYLTSGSQYLRELDISGCFLLTDRSLRHLKRICPPLTSIKMICCSSISWAAALKLQTRVSHWEYSNHNPPGWFDRNANKLAKADGTWNVEEKHYAMT
ncbi:hypothetical protein ILYODFUR_033055 [Ilyodon furcidens]|uniref:Uncharacterized protein n=1 Tax=Ilyodon furcidens TaxID=33524 RepID=A0ABV0UP24_9TELE